MVVRVVTCVADRVCPIFNPAQMQACVFTVCTRHACPSVHKGVHSCMYGVRSLHGLSGLREVCGVCLACVRHAVRVVRTGTRACCYCHWCRSDAGCGCRLAAISAPSTCSSQAIQTVLSVQAVMATDLCEER